MVTKTMLGVSFELEEDEEQNDVFGFSFGGVLVERQTVEICRARGGLKV